MNLLVNHSQIDLAGYLCKMPANTNARNMLLHQTVNE
jgi:hypothetical protein